MKNRHHGWLVAVFIDGYDGAAYEEFCDTDAKAERAEARAWEEHDDVETVTIDEVWYDPITGEYEAV